MFIQNINNINEGVNLNIETVKYLSTKDQL